MSQAIRKGRTPGTVVVALRSGDASYPGALSRCLAEAAPPVILCRGDPGTLGQHKVAFFSSRRCPGNAIIGAYDLARALRDAGVCVVSGFHSSMEKECLDLLLRGTQPVIICPARTIDPMRIPAAWKVPLAEGRLLLLSSFESKHRRATAALAQQRNEFVAALADEIIICYAEPGGRTESLVAQAIAWGKRVMTFDLPETKNLVALGAISMNVDQIAAAVQNSA